MPQTDARATATDRTAGGGARPAQRVAALPRPLPTGRALAAPDERGRIGVPPPHRCRQPVHHRIARGFGLKRDEIDDPPGKPADGRARVSKLDAARAVAVEKVLEAAGESPDVVRLYAACLEGEGDSERAAELYRRALALTFGA